MYIAHEQRPPIDELVDPLGEHVDTESELAYAITRLCHVFQMRRPHKLGHLNGVTGTLENVKLEFYNSTVGPYLAQKLLDNGGIFDDPPGSGRGGSDLGDEAEGPVAPRPGAVRTTVLGGTE